MKTIRIAWEQAPGKGAIQVINGTLSSLRLAGGRGSVKGQDFNIPPGSGATLAVAVRDEKVGAGANATRVTVGGDQSFTFFLRDVNAALPILVEEYGVAVTAGDDRRSYDGIAAAIRARGLVGEAQRIAAEPEESFAAACAVNRNLVCPTWLGLSRDMRVFRVGFSRELGYWGYVSPCHHCTPRTVNGKALDVGFMIGPGSSCRVDITRRLEDGVLPILHSTQREDDVVYDLTAFATLETRPITLKNLRGSEWRAVYPNSGGHMLSKEECAALQPILDAEMNHREEETVCWVRVVASNTGAVPRYAWFKATHAGAAPKAAFDGERGWATMDDGKMKVYGINLLDGKPVPQTEMAIMIQPGAKIVYDMLIPHQPLPPERAQRLARADFDAHHAACRKFWLDKLAAGAQISVPETAIDERIRAGLLHCDIVAYGKEPDGDVLATIGWYAPIGSESSPIIQFFDSMGWHKLAERSLQFFFDRQRADGFIQNFGGYQLETGPALWTAGEHYRYTRDDAWVRRVKPNLLKGCEFLLAWRERNKRPELRGKGYGLLDGKVADPEDFFHSFMLNGLSYVGIARVAEMLAKVDPSASRRLAREARAYRADIRTAYYESLARSPVVPAGDGTWLPAPPPWSEYPGPLSLYAEGGIWQTHGAFGARDTLIGSLYLVISEVLDPREIGTTLLLKSHQVLFTVRNAALSQPYYCRHDFTHLKRGEVTAFLKTYYNQFTALQDRQTYTFWEHYFHASQHKTHEEGWFLMQTRWMLWLEEDGGLSFLRAVPRRWLADGQRIALRDIATYFGRATLEVESRLGQDRTIRATIKCSGTHRPRRVRVRLPHPANQVATSVEGGAYDPATETVTIPAFRGSANVVLQF